MPFPRTPWPASPRTRRAAALLVLLTAGAMPLARAQADIADVVRELLARGEHAAALERARQAAEARPRDAPAQFLHAVVLMEMGRDAEALARFTTLSQLYPELPDPLNNIALLHARAGRLDAALQALQAALRNDPAHRVARANLGQVHLMLAVQAWEQAAAAGPLDAPLQRKLEGARALLAAPAITAGAR
jgi:Flp pilus assembly protein TadD